MERFRVVGAWRENGADGELMVDAVDARSAAAYANDRGLMVARVEAGPSPVDPEQPLRPSRLDQYVSRRSVGSLGSSGVLWDWLLFRRLLTPWLIRVGFVVFTALVLISAVVEVGARLLDLLGIAEPNVSTPLSRPSLVLTAPYQLGEVWHVIQPLSVAAIVLCVVRVGAEFIVVIFVIQEELVRGRSRIDRLTRM
jgi:hypothetical protein